MKCFKSFEQIVSNEQIWLQQYKDLSLDKTTFNNQIVSLKQIQLQLLSLLNKHFQNIHKII